MKTAWTLKHLRSKLNTSNSELQPHLLIMLRAKIHRVYLEILGSRKVKGKASKLLIYFAKELIKTSRHRKDFRPSHEVAYNQLQS